MARRYVLLVTLLLQGLLLRSSVAQDLWPSRMLEEAKLLEIGSRAPDFEVSNLSGDTVRLSKLGAKVVLIDFWFRGCPPCHQLRPDLNELQKTYGEEGFVVLSIDPYSRDLKKYMETIKEDDP